MFNLTKNQLTEAVYQTIIQGENGLNDMLTIVLNALMKSERAYWLQGKDRWSPNNKANGYRPAFVMGHGKSLQLAIPRDRLGVFKPFILALLRDEEQRVKECCFDLYGYGLTISKISSLIDKLYGKEYSRSAISSITSSFAEAMQEWRERPIEEFYPVIFIDAIHIKVRREAVSNEAFYVVLGIKEDMSREVIGIINLPQESAEGWRFVLQDLQSRGLDRVSLVVSDDLKGLDQAIHEEFPRAKVQKCVVHLKRNILSQVKPSHRKEVEEGLKQIFVTQQEDFTRAKAKKAVAGFVARWQQYYPTICRKLTHVNIFTYYLTYLDYHPQVRRMLYTTNWLERLNKTFREAVQMRGSFPNPRAALTILSKVAMDANDGIYRRPIYALQRDTSLFSSKNNERTSSLNLTT